MLLLVLLQALLLLELRPPVPEAVGVAGFGIPAQALSTLEGDSTAGCSTTGGATSAAGAGAGGCLLLVLGVRGPLVLLASMLPTSSSTHHLLLESASPLLRCSLLRAGLAQPAAPIPRLTLQAAAGPDMSRNARRNAPS